MSGPARGYTWPTAGPGNTIALKTGAWSPRTIDPLARQLVERFVADADWLRPVDFPAVWAWARTEARVQLLTEYLMDHGGDLSADDTSRRASDLLTKLESRAESLRSKLGFDPLSRARLGRDVAATRVDLVALGDVGARLVAAQGAVAAAVDDDTTHGASAAVAAPEQAENGL